MKVAGGARRPELGSTAAGETPASHGGGGAGAPRPAMARGQPGEAVRAARRRGGVAGRHHWGRAPGKARAVARGRKGGGGRHGDGLGFGCDNLMVERYTNLKSF